MIQFFEEGGFELTVPVIFTRPIIEGVTKVRDPDLGYVVPMYKLPTRFPNGVHSLKMHFLNFVADNNLQLGFPYYIMEDFPRKCLNIVQILDSMDLDVGFDIDDDGFLTYDKEETTQ